MANTRIRKPSPLLTSQGKRLAGLGAGALLALCLAFGAGVAWGRQAGARAAGAAIQPDLSSLDVPARAEETGPGEPVKEASASPTDFSFHQPLAAPPAAPAEPPRVATLPPPAAKGPVLTSSVAGADRDGGKPDAAPAPAPALAPAPAAVQPPPALAAAPSEKPAPRPARPSDAAAQAPKPSAPTAKPAAPGEKPAPRLAVADRARAPKPAAPAAETIPAGAFSVQVGAASSLADAQHIAARFKKHHPHIVASDVEGKGRWYRVRLGVFPTRAEAARFQRSAGLQGYVTASR
ncbi:SPOR domain-containing protein [Anaeromyxobacter paludicola]|uniref:SPOR domain-containing protein n=1 Tax=Anaeromyxobacter paludicola TaxID=2918171 RepID=A0ABM7X7L9_9BACT|nr:SPOR domain-containing protein [Anaeromyxobacter paludicola]BDG07829.1 hypothetical protein AMPC_09420 [Anaeromyxobacter paludicola]